jgi:hypothetical protein
MPIQSTDILWKYSIKNPTSGGNSSSQLDQNESLGGFIATTTWPGSALADLFDDISGNENAALTVDYRCVFIHNNHSTLILQNPVIFISNQNTSPGHALPAIGIDTNAASPIGQATAQAVSITNETTAPAGVTFSTPTSQPSGLAIGNLFAGFCRAIWIRRTAVNGDPVNNDGFTLKVIGESLA